MIDLNDVSLQFKQLQDAVGTGRPPKRTTTQLMGVLDAVVEELNITIEELGLQNEELRLANHLQKTEAQRYRDVFTQAPDAHIITDQLGIIREANEAASILLNVESRMLLGKPLSVYIGQPDRRAFRRLLQNLSEFDIAQVVEVAIQPRGRIPVHVEIATRALAESNVESVSISWMLRDVTDRDRHLREIRALNAVLEQRLAEQTSQLREANLIRDAGSARESTPSWLSGSDSRRLDFLAEASETMSETPDPGGPLNLLLSCTVPVVADWGVIALLDDDDDLVVALAAHENPDRNRDLRVKIGSDSFEHGSMLTYAHHVLSTGMPHSHAKDDGRADDTTVPATIDWLAGENLKNVSMLSVPLRSRGKTLGVLELGRGQSRAPFDSDDLSYALILTGRAIAAFDAARLAERARTTEAARDHFLAVAAHEFRTPITIFRGYAQILARYLADAVGSDSARARRMASAIEQQSDQLSVLVEQLVDASRLQTDRQIIRLSRANLSVIVEDQVAVAQAASVAHQLELQLEANVEAQVDEIRFTQVVAHLLDNAVKFSPDGGTIEVKLERAGEDYVRLSVTDHGIGLDPSQRDRIFDRFYQAHGRTEIRGMGLGLFVGREIMRRHGGDLRVELPDGSITRFVAELPTNGARAAG